ncbi:laccase [Penicillium malachiteum]|nr:laccase [Penicillium malachiteum]
MVMISISLVRRDVAFMPAYGRLVIAFKADNPGAWLLHYQIAFHLGEGIGLQFLDAKDKISLSGSDWKKTCTNWDRFWDGQHPYTLLGSGL